ncbi:MAG: hypothetical protein AB7C97_03945 [Oscillospiraceae bacterium]
MLKSEKGNECPDVNRTPMSMEHETRFSAAAQRSVQKSDDLKNLEKSQNNEKRRV